MKKNKLNWYNVTLRQFTILQEILTKTEDETERLLSIAELIFGEDVVNLPIVEFKEKVKQLDFLKEPIPEVTPPKKIEVNGKKYFVDCLLGNITTAQYIDFTNHSKTGDVSKILSVFIIPDGHKYNDGYDMLQVFNDINDLPVPVINSLAFFFKRQLETFIRIFQSYSIKKIKKMKIPKEMKENMIETVKSSAVSALYPLF